MIGLRYQLFELTNDGLLEWSIDPITEEAVFWPTPLGERVLGMSA
jgi:hypothetical protein